MRALSVRQPWAAAIAYFGKTVENRSRATRHRGLIAVHASLELAEGADAAVERICEITGYAPRIVLARDARGAILGVAEIVGCHQSGDTDHCDAGGVCSPWAQPGQWHWEIGNARALSWPYGVRGALGLWRLDEDADRWVRDVLDLGATPPRPPEDR